MNILVTGGAGFIGSHIVDSYIAENHNVIVIDNLSTGKIENINPKANFYKIDINSDELEAVFQNYQIDVINHHAAQIDVRVSVDDPIFDASVNIVGSLKLYELARKYRVKKIIFASSGGAIYGEQIYFPADEEHPLAPCSPYGITKLTNEKYLFYYHTVHNIDFVSLRYSNVYGPRQNPFGEAGVVAIFIKKMLLGEQPIIHGDGNNTRDFVYVSDIVQANLIALGSNIKGVFNVGTGIEHNVNYIFKKLKELTNSNASEFHGPPKIGEQRRSVLSYEKFKKQTGWEPKINLDEGLKLTVDYFKRTLLKQKM